MKVIPVSAVAALRDQWRKKANELEADSNRFYQLADGADDLDALIASAQETPDGCIECRRTRWEIEHEGHAIECSEYH